MRGWIPAQWMPIADAGEFVRVIENRQGIMLSAVEEIAYHNGWIDKETLLKSAEVYGKSMLWKTPAPGGQTERFCIKRLGSEMTKHA